MADAASERRVARLEHEQSGQASVRRLCGEGAAAVVMRDSVLFLFLL